MYGAGYLRDGHHVGGMEQDDLRQNMFAVGSNEEAARVSGVNVMATIIGVFMLAGALYGYTGFVEAARLGSSTRDPRPELRG